MILAQGLDILHLLHIEHHGIDIALTARVLLRQALGHRRGGLSLLERGADILAQSLVGIRCRGANRHDTGLLIFARRRDDQRNLALYLAASTQLLGELGGGPAQDLLVQLGEFAADGNLTLGKDLRHGLERRFYKKNPIIIFLVSALLGASFEVFVGWFMQTSFGVVSWSYSHMKLFGMPDPLAVLTGGRTCTGFACLWGLGGLIWIKLLLPRLLKLINMIPWKSRYSATVIFTIIMLVDGVMTLQSLDYWYQRVNGTEPDIPVAQFYGKYFDNDFMENRFQSMTMSPKDATRV